MNLRMLLRLKGIVVMSDKTKAVIRLVCKVVSYIATLVAGAVGGSDAVNAFLS